MAKLHNVDVKSKRPKLRVLQRAISLSSLVQSKIVAALLVGKYIVVTRLSDVASAVEALAKSIGKYFSDTANTSDSATKDIGKAPTDISAAEDATSFAVDKSLSDTSLAGDSTFISAGKAAADASVATDSFASHPNKAAQDTGVTSDAVNFDATKAPIDIAQLSDSASFSSTKALSDNVYSTDDVGGEASVDDDQYVSFFKNYTDLAFVAESLQKEMGVARSDTAGITDTAGAHPNKGIQDSSSAIDSITTGVSKAEQDISFVSDLMEFLLVAERQLSDAATISDLVNALISKAFSDSASSSDTANITVTKAQYDTLSIADSGYAFWQDYVDNLDYFAEDYIGTTQTFN